MRLSFPGFLFRNLPRYTCKMRFNTTLLQRTKSPIKGKVIAIRREDQSVWERRAPLAPSNVLRLVRAGVRVLVQPSNRRAYPIQSYIQAGAVPQEDIGKASVIFGVKQVPAEFLLPDKTYCMFSHTIKAQESNMPLLDAILEKNIRLIDYEKLVSDGQRVVAFGKYAGVAGMINILHGLGLRLLALGHHTPFMHIGPAHNYRNSSIAIQAIKDVGYEIALGMMPKSIGPLIFVFTGSGNVSQGAQEVFSEFPHELVPPNMLQKVAEHGVTTMVYGCQVRRRDYLKRKEGGGFDADEFDAHPERYLSTFGKQIAPWASVIVNGIYWAVGSPKLLTLSDAKELLIARQPPWLPVSEGAPALPHRTLAICDISADPGGSIEFMNECTTIDTPFCLYDADRNKDTNSFKGKGLLVCSIDNMPTQLPREATEFFGDLVLPYAIDILQSDATRPLEDHDFDPVVANAIIASNGKLTPKYEYIQELRQESKRNQHKGSDAVGGGRPSKKVLVLGAGRVSAPLVKYLNRDESIQITLASSVADEASQVGSECRRVEPLLVDVTNPDALHSLVSSADLVVSLLPAPLHPLVARSCIHHQTHLVTASYCSPELKELHQQAVDAGVTVVNEVGLDPGIDHLLAMECIDEVHQAGGWVESFVSYCGGLPAPEHSDNPLRYKFSWSPRGVLLNMLGDAKYLLNSKVVEVARGGDLLSSGSDLDFLPGFALEGYPNRDSLPYAQLYGIAAEAHTMLRGSLRYRGFLNTMNSLKGLGLIDLEPHPALHPDGPDITWRELMCQLVGLSHSDVFYDNLRGRVCERAGGAGAAVALEQLGLLDDAPIVKCTTPLDTLTDHLARTLALGDNERDVVILRHELMIRWPCGQAERHLVSLVQYGAGAGPGTTAMATTVGLPAAVAATMVLDGEIQERGMVYPLTPHIYRPMLSRLRAEGIISTTTVEKIN